MASWTKFFDKNEGMMSSESDPNIVRIRHGDCVEEMKEISSNTVDAVVTDPPYLIDFMNKKWDSGKERNFHLSWMQEAFRILKPGGILKAFAAPRTLHRLLSTMASVGFTELDTEGWVYGCLDDESEVLTPNGWKNREKLSTKDKILQWNMYEEKFSWAELESINVYDHYGVMILFENEQICHAVTLNHRIPIYTEDQFESQMAHKIKKEQDLFFPAAGHFSGSVSVQEPFFIGWWISSETESVSKKSIQKTIWEKTPYIERILKTKNLSWEVLSWDEESVGDLLQGVLEAQEQHKQDIPTLHISSSVNREILQVLFAMQAERAVVDGDTLKIYYSGLTKVSLSPGMKSHPTFFYEGAVWCPSVRDRCFLTRRKGRINITGNSGFPKNMRVDHRLAEMEEYDLSERFSGYGTALKPAIEVVGIGYKPKEG